MSPTKTDTLKVPGATLYYEVRGSGPVLLLICGGVYDAAGYAGLAGQLADRYTVVTYDRRGNSRSPLDGPPEQQSIEVHGDDAHRVLSAVGVTGDEKAYVFGNSSGAQMALELAARHPEQVRRVVAHEPPCLDLLPDADHFRALIKDAEAAFAEQGAGAALGIFGAGMHMRSGEPDGGDESGRRRAGAHSRRSRCPAGRARPGDGRDDGAHGPEHGVLHRLRGTAVRPVDPGHRHAARVVGARRSGRG